MPLGLLAEPARYSHQPIEVETTITTGVGDEGPGRRSSVVVDIAQVPVDVDLLGEMRAIP